MMRKVLNIILVLIAGVGAGLSVAMLISAIGESEWGRVLFYCVTLAVCVEFAVLSISRLIPRK